MSSRSTTGSGSSAPSGRVRSAGRLRRGASCPRRSWTGRAKDPHAKALKALLIARRGAVKARTAAIRQIKDLLVTAPADLRERYRRYTTTLTLVRALTRCRPTAHENPVTTAVLTACRTWRNASNSSNAKPMS